MSPIKLVTGNSPDAVASYHDWLAHRHQGGSFDRKFVVTLGYNISKIEAKRCVG